MTDTTFEHIREAVEAYHPEPDLRLLQKAYLFARKLHDGQVRASGEPYMTHILETSLLVCRLKLDLPSVAAALLHDTLEDCPVTGSELRDQFGDEITDIVEGVTKLTRIEFDSKEEKQAESFRKMLIAMAKDIRVILVKLCDRLHNMRTLEHLPEIKQRRIATETMEIYAPLANRLGIYWLKSELEDLCLMYLRPEIYQLIRESLAKSKDDREAYVQRTCEEIQKELEKAGVSASVGGRSKHFYSIWKKMDEQHLTFEDVHDLHGFRIVVPTLRACYESLGVIHSKFKPVPGRFKDYVAMPKPNMYQSLHTTVIGPQGQRIEVQIRTPEMHRVAEEGIAAHWKYKEAGKSIPVSEAGAGFDLRWVKELVETQQYLKNPDEFIQSVKGELFPEDVFVFSPKGDLTRLPFGSTPIDFAYSVHTDVGHHAAGARVNGSIVPIDKALENGDTVEIITSKNQVPSRDWLRFVRSSKAKQRIRAFLKSEEHARSLALGMDLLSRDLRKVKLSLKKLEKDGKLAALAESMGLRSQGDLYAQIGYGKISSAKVVAKLLPDGFDVSDQAEKEPSALKRIFQRAAKSSRDKVGIKVSGLDDIMLRFAKCCEPLPGDRIVGFITRGRGVTVHQADCPQVHRLDPLRRVDVSWDDGARAQRRVRVTVYSQDKMGMLSNITRAITDHGANISSAQAKTYQNGRAMHEFELAVEDANQLQRLLRAIERVPGVLKVERVMKMTG